MAELWLPSERRVARWDPSAEQLRAVGWRPGPAGVSAVDLADGLRVVVDHASPTTLTELSVDLVRGRIIDAHLDLLHHLLGADAVDRLRRLPGARGHGRPVRLPSSVDDLVDRRHADEHEAFARMVLGADLGDDAVLLDTLRPVALLEAAIVAFDIHRPFALDLTRRGVELLDDVGGPQDSKVAYQLASILRTDADRARPDPIADAASRWAQRLARGAASRSELVMPAAMAPMAAPRAAAPAAARLASPAQATDAGGAPGAQRPVPVGGDRRGWAWLDAGNNVVVTAPGSPDGAWARVFRSTDRLLLGLSPLRRGEDGTSKALVVIPPTEDLTVDLVDDPSTPLRAPAHDEVRRAVLVGREAARLSRLGRDEADGAWAECAARWAGLGDTQRANLARRHGRREPGSPRRRAATTKALLVDGLE